MTHSPPNHLLNLTESQPARTVTLSGQVNAHSCAAASTVLIRTQQQQQQQREREEEEEEVPASTAAGDARATPKRLRKRKATTDSASENLAKHASGLDGMLAVERGESSPILVIQASKDNWNNLLVACLRLFNSWPEVMTPNMMKNLSQTCTELHVQFNTICGRVNFEELYNRSVDNTKERVEALVPRIRCLHVTQWSSPRLQSRILPLLPNFTSLKRLELTAWNRYDNAISNTLLHALHRHLPQPLQHLVASSITFHPSHLVLTTLRSLEVTHCVFDAFLVPADTVPPPEPITWQLEALHIRESSVPFSISPLRQMSRLIVLPRLVSCSRMGLHSDHRRIRNSHDLLLNLTGTSVTSRLPHLRTLNVEHREFLMNRPFHNVVCLSFYKVSLRSAASDDSLSLPSKLEKLLLIQVSLPKEQSTFSGADKLRILYYEALWLEVDQQKSPLETQPLQEIAQLLSPECRKSLTCLMISNKLRDKLGNTVKRKFVLKMDVLNASFPSLSQLYILPSYEEHHWSLFQRHLRGMQMQPDQWDSGHVWNFYTDVHSRIGKAHWSLTAQVIIDVLPAQLTTLVMFTQTWNCLHLQPLPETLFNMFVVELELSRHSSKNGKSIRKRLAKVTIDKYMACHPLPIPE